MQSKKSSVTKPRKNGLTLSQFFHRGRASEFSSNNNVDDALHLKMGLKTENDANNTQHRLLTDNCHSTSTANKLRGSDSADDNEVSKGKLLSVVERASVKHGVRVSTLMDGV